jgi:prepilin peptidase CpaA
MPDFEFRYLLLGALAIALLFAAFTDIRRRQIDNWLNAAIAAGAPLYWWASGLTLWPDVAWQAGVAAVTLMILAVLFAMRAMGGGDVKLLTALALWMQPLWFVRLLIGMALIGGALTILLGAWHVIRRRRDKLAVPYGVAISSAALWVLALQFLPAFSGAVLSGGAG